MTIKYTYDFVHELPVKLDDGAHLPTRAHANDAGLDLYVPDWFSPYGVRPGGSMGIDTGVHVGIQSGYVGMVFPRSGLNIKHEAVCGTGVVDAGFTGSIKVRLYNHGSEVLKVMPGDRIAQLVIMPVWLLAPVEVQSLGESERGDSGCGSTGR